MTIYDLLDVVINAANTKRHTCCVEVAKKRLSLKPIVTGSKHEIDSHSGGILVNR